MFDFNKTYLLRWSYIKASNDGYITKEFFRTIGIRFKS